MVNKLFLNLNPSFLAHTHPWLEQKGIEISFEQWEKTTWPDYIAGLCVFMTAESARKMAQTAAITKKAVTIPIEDLVFNGIIREKACLDLENAEKVCTHLKGNTRKLKILLGKKMAALQQIRSGPFCGSVPCG